MTEKAILRKMFLGVVLMVGFFLISLLVMQACFDQTYEAECRYLTEYHQQLGVDFDSSAYTYEVDETDLIRVKEIKEKNHRIICVVEPTGAKQSGLVEIRVRMANAAEALDNVWIKVDAHGRITDTETFNIPHYRAYQLAVILLLVGLCVLLWGGAVVSYRKLRYSYHTIYCIGLGIWMTVMSVTMIIYYAGEVNMLNTYQALVDAATRFSVITFPFVALFAIALTISNISLIRHEGFRTNNALGILLSGMMIVAFFAIQLFSGLFSSGPTLTVTIWSAITESLQIIYVVLECFLIGAIVLGTISAKHTPSYDRDYLVILGCKIRKDGTLYPLIRGRVDRAIRFSREQEAATGKKAVFIPSGGQGNDEVISEAEAMQRYLLEQGIEESRILVEKNSKNTRENMLFSKELMKEGSKAAFSTTNFHVFRSGIISRQVGMDIDGMGSPTKWYFWPNAYIREVIGMLSYKWKSLAFMMVVITILLTALRFRFTI